MSKEQVMDYVMTTPSNPNKAVLEGMLDSIVEAGGGGDEYLGIHTATVNVTFDTSEVGGDNILSITDAHIDCGYSEKSVNLAIQFVYGDGHIPVTELGTPTQMILPISDIYPLNISHDSLVWEVNSGLVIISDATVVSGSATGSISPSGGDIVITGDCALNIKVMYQD